MNTNKRICALKSYYYFIPSFSAIATTSSGSFHSLIPLCIHSHNMHDYIVQTLPLSDDGDCIWFLLYYIYCGVDFKGILQVVHLQWKNRYRYRYRYYTYIGDCLHIIIKVIIITRKKRTLAFALRSNCKHADPNKTADRYGRKIHFQFVCRLFFKKYK